MTYRNLMIIAALLSALASCQKEPAGTPEKDAPKMAYQNFNGKVITEPLKAFHIDLDNDGHADVNIKTEPVSDGSNYYMRYMVGTSVGTLLLLDDNDQTSAMLRNTVISAAGSASHHWYDVAATILTEKVTPSEGYPFWQGNWPDGVHRYVAVMHYVNDKCYLGWLELSIDRQTGAMELHRAGISTEPCSAVKAGN